MITPALADDAFLADVERPLAEGALRAWWLGQSGFLVRFGTRRLLLDPYLSDSLTEKYATTDKPHTRMTARVIAPDRLRKIDVVTSTHNHTDHLDAATLLPLRDVNPGMALIIPEANREFVAQRLGVAASTPIGLDESCSIVASGFEIHGIAAAHNELERDEAGHHRFLGYVIRVGRWTIFHSGDTLLYPGLVEKLRRFAPIDLALLPINGNKPERRVAGNLDGAEAAELGHAIGARCVIPCHYEMFAFNTADPRELFIPECERFGQHCRVLRAGESVTLPE